MRARRSAGRLANDVEWTSSSSTSELEVVERCISSFARLELYTKRSLGAIEAREEEDMDKET